MAMSEILDFGDEAVKDVETKLKILKFDYSWAEEVEKHERRMQEAQKHTRRTRKAQKTPQKLTSGDDHNVATPKSHNVAALKSHNVAALKSRQGEPPISMVDHKSNFVTDN